MKIIIHSLTTALLLVVGYVVFNSKEEIGKSKELHVVLIKQAPQPIAVIDGKRSNPLYKLHTSKTQSKLRMPSSSEQQYKKPILTLDSFSKVDIEFFDGKYFLVEGVYASIDPLPGQKEIGKVGGFFIYDQKAESTLPVVFDVRKNKYGVFTGEIIVKGNFSKAMSVINSAPLEVLYKNELTHQVILKAENIQDLTALESLKGLPNISIQLDLKFARARRM